MVNPYLDLSYGTGLDLSEVNRMVVPFVGCGDLSAFDSDQTFELEYESLDPVQAPLEPAYKKHIEMKRSNAFKASTASGPQVGQ